MTLTMRTMKRIWRGFADVLSAKQSSENVELGNSSAVQTVDGRSQSMSPDTLMEDLVRDEGLRLELYQDSVGKWTIGVGRNLDDVGISEDEAMYLLRNDISRAKRDLEKALPWVKDLDIVRYNVLVNMCFNMGIGSSKRGLLSFRYTLGLIQKGEYDKASFQMLHSKWAKQVGIRAHRLSVKMREGK